MTDEIKSFLEHLRTVHFTLLATCLALLAATLPEPPEDLKLAKRDLARIHTAINSNMLPKLLNRSFLLAARGSGTWKAKDIGTHAFLLSFRKNNREFQLHGKLRANPVITLEEQAIPAVEQDGELTVSCADVIRADFLIREFEVLLDSNSTLEDFIRFWDCLPNLRAVSVVDTHYDKATSVTLGPQIGKSFSNNFLRIEPVIGKYDDLRKDVIEPAFPAMQFRLNNQGSMILEFDPSMGRSVVSPKDFGATPNHYLSRSAASSFSTNKNGSSEATVFTIPFVVPLSTRARFMTVQAIIIEEFFSGASPGVFERRFPQIASWVGDRKNRPPKILVEDIQRDLSRAAESFEVFGVKIPLSLIAKIGVIVLMAIEVYFCLHLRRLSELLERNDTFPDFPWIGIYPDRLSKSVFVFAVVIAPTCIASWLFFNSWEQLPFVTKAVLSVGFAGIQGFMVSQLYSFWRSWPRSSAEDVR